MALTELDLRSWFADNELEPCPRCNHRSALPTPHEGFLVCLECGLLDAEGKRVDDLPRSAGSLSLLTAKERPSAPGRALPRLRLVGFVNSVVADLRGDLAGVREA